MNIIVQWNWNLCYKCTMQNIFRDLRQFLCPLKLSALQWAPSFMDEFVVSQERRQNFWLINFSKNYVKHMGWMFPLYLHVDEGRVWKTEILTIEFVWISSCGCWCVCSNNIFKRNSDSAVKEQQFQFKNSLKDSKRMYKHIDRIGKCVFTSCIV